MIPDITEQAILDPAEEIKAIRHRLGAKLNYDLALIFADIQRCQEEGGRTYINLPPRKPADIKSIPTTDRSRTGT